MMTFCVNWQGEITIIINNKTLTVKEHLISPVFRTFVEVFGNNRTHKKASWQVEKWKGQNWDRYRKTLAKRRQHKSPTRVRCILQSKRRKEYITHCRARHIMAALLSASSSQHSIIRDAHFGGTQGATIRIIHSYSAKQPSLFIFFIHSNRQSRTSAPEVLSNFI